jgi:hypothetical protein
MVPLGFIPFCFSGLNFGLALGDDRCGGFTGNSISRDLLDDISEDAFPSIGHLSSWSAGTTSQGAAAPCFSPRGSGKVFDALLVTSVVDTQDQVVNQRRHGHQKYEDVQN